ncbi:MAG: hypothetical protein V9G12_24970 [Microthrixaceae bacterium]
MAEPDRFPDVGHETRSPSSALPGVRPFHRVSQSGTRKMPTKNTTSSDQDPLHDVDGPGGEDLTFEQHRPAGANEGLKDHADRRERGDVDELRKGSGGDAADDVVEAHGFRCDDAARHGARAAAGAAGGSGRAHHLAEATGLLRWRRGDRPVHR